MTPEELAVILEAHKRWLFDEPDGQRADLRWADLREANLRGADLQGADLRWANLRGANLQWADLRWADLDFSALPLWCGLFDLKCDQRMFAQVAYHLCRMDVPDELHVYQDALRDIARKFHRFDECGGLPDREEDKS